MATTKFIVHGFLGSELVIDGSVQTSVLFALTDEKQTSLAWYGYRANAAKWHERQFDAHNFSTITTVGFKKPEADDDFATVDHAGTLFLYPGQLSVAGLASNTKGSSIARAANLDLKDQDTGLTSCILSIPDVQPVSALFAFNLVTRKKRRTFDLKKDGIVDLIVIEKFTHHALRVGPNPSFLRAKSFRK